MGCSPLALPLGELARERLRGQALCDKAHRTAIGRLFVRVIRSLSLCGFASGLALSVIADAMPPPPKWEALAVHAKCVVSPGALPLTDFPRAGGRWRVSDKRGSWQSRQALTERARTVVLRPCFLLYMYKSGRTAHTKHCAAGAAEFSTGRKACGLCILHRKCAL